MVLNMNKSMSGDGIACAQGDGDGDGGAAASDESVLTSLGCVTSQPRRLMLPHTSRRAPSSQRGRGRRVRS